MIENECALFLLAVKTEPMNFVVETPEVLNLNYSPLNGMACMPNKTLTFIAMDSLKYHHFAERFSVDVLKQKDKSSVILLNEKVIDLIYLIYICLPLLILLSFYFISPKSNVEQPV